MTRRVWLPVAVMVAGLFATGLWMLRVAQDIGGKLADMVNGGNT